MHAAGSNSIDDIRVELALGGKDAGGKRLRGIIFGNANRLLVDDWSMIEQVIDEVHRATADSASLTKNCFMHAPPVVTLSSKGRD